jgi:D-alanyl-D-alanine carboxypeptidase/D-alanyl-D-alanine-endopeptidase (penicillin-binding protein 4)
MGTMRILLTSLSFLLLRADAPPPSGEVLVAEWVRSKPLEGLDVGVALIWTDTGEPVAAHRADELRVPASCAKLLTTAAALLEWPEGHRWRTELRADISPEGVVRALALVGQGDPRLVPEDLEALAKELYARGARKVEGGLQVVPLGFGPQPLPPGFEIKETDAGYRPLVGAAASAFGAVTVTVTPAKEVGAPLRVSVDPPTGYVEVTSHAVTLAPGAVSTLEVRATPDSQEARMRVEVEGGLALGAKPTVQRKRVVHPNLFTGWLLRAKLEGQKIRVSGPIREAPEAPALPIVLVHDGRPLEALVADVNTWSNNFMAEMLFHQLGGPAPCAWDRAAATVGRRLGELGLHAGGLSVRNGSGLYAATRVSAANLARLLTAMARHPTRAATFRDSLAVGGRTGTLAHRLTHRAVRGRVRAKTGTLDDAWSLSGYLTTASGRELAFAILVQGGDASRTTGVERAVDSLVRSLVGLGRKPATRRGTR